MMFKNIIKNLIYNKKYARKTIYNKMIMETKYYLNKEIKKLLKSFKRCLHFRGRAARYLILITIILAQWEKARK